MLRVHLSGFPQQPEEIPSPGHSFQGSRDHIVG